MPQPPMVVFVCYRNAGKSQMAAALMRQHASDAVTVHSAGTHPGSAINSESIAALAEIGASIDGEFTKAIDSGWLDEATRVVVLGEHAQIEKPGRAPIERWTTVEPLADGIEGAQRMRLIRDDIDQQVRVLAQELVTDQVQR